jgi:oxygen-dependent protoporphyrinogen oxidase
MWVHQRIVIVGGGVTGLAAAHRLQEMARDEGLPLEVRLYEAGPRLGGVISTQRRDGFVLEHGPDSLITDKPWGLALARRLGLEDELTGTAETHRRSFVVRDGRLLPVPEGFQLLAPSRFGPLAMTPIFSWPGKLRMAMDWILPRRDDPSDESLGAFVERRLGREALERMAQPMIAGIYGADPMDLSLHATLPRFRDMEREHGSVIRAMRARMKAARASNGSGSGKRSGASTAGVSGARYGLFVSLKQGMQTLTDRLAERLEPGTAVVNAPVRSLERFGDGWSLEAGGERVEAAAVILSLPAYRSAELLRPLDAEAAALLDRIPYASAGTLSLVYRRGRVRHPLDGFGFVVPSIEPFRILGCTFSHAKWPGRAPEGYAVLRAFLGEAALRDRTEAELEALVRDDLDRLLGLEGDPEFSVLWRGTRCMPHYTVGHLDRLAELDRRLEALPGLALAGNAFRGIGIPDSIHSGEQAAERILAAITAPAVR